MIIWYLRVRILKITFGISTHSKCLFDTGAFWFFFQISIKIFYKNNLFSIGRNKFVLPCKLNSEIVEVPPMWPVVFVPLNDDINCIFAIKLIWRHTRVASFGIWGCKERDFVIRLLHNILLAYTKQMECTMITIRGNSHQVWFAIFLKWNLPSLLHQTGPMCPRNLKSMACCSWVSC